MGRKQETINRSGTGKSAGSAGPGRRSEFTSEPAKRPWLFDLPWATLAAIVLIVLAGMAAYAKSLDGPLIFDDLPQIRENQRVERLWPPWAPLVDTTRPVAIWSFAANHSLGGWNVRGYHAANLAIHLAAGLTLFGLVRRTFRGPRLAARYGDSATGLALAAALLWTVHPLNTQAVTYVVQRMESLMGLFYLLTLYCFARAAGLGESSRRKTAAGRRYAVASAVWWQAASVACCALGMGTKEVMVTAPVMVLWYDRVFVADSWKQILERRWPYYVALAGTWAVLIAAILGLSEGYATGGDVLVIEGLSPLQYVLTQAGVILHYVRLSLWPSPLCLDYAWPVASACGQIVPPLMVIGLLAGLTLWWMFRRPAWGFLGGCFFLVLSPTSSVVPIIDVAFEHRMYLPLAAVVIVTVLGVFTACHALVDRGWLPRPAAFAVGGCLVVLAGATLGTLTFQRNTDYQNDLGIWRDTVAKAPRNPRAHCNLGVMLGAQGQHLAEAIEEFQVAIEYRPKYADARSNLGMALRRQGKIREAIEQCGMALEINPRSAPAHCNLGLALHDQGRVGEAIEHYGKALEIAPRYAQAHFNLANSLYETGRIDEAIESYSKALEIDPDYADAHCNLGEVLQRQGKTREAIAHWSESLRVQPDDTDVLRLVGWALATSPDATVRDGAKAAALAERAEHLSGGGDPAIVDVRAAAYAEKGDFGRAVQVAQQALRLAVAQNNMALATAVQARIKLYEAGAPFRDVR